MVPIESYDTDRENYQNKMNAHFLNGGFQQMANLFLLLYVCHLCFCHFVFNWENAEW